MLNGDRKENGKKINRSKETLLLLDKFERRWQKVTTSLFNSYCSNVAKQLLPVLLWLNISKKKNKKNNHDFACAAHFFVHCFAFVLQLQGDIS